MQAHSILPAIALIAGAITSGIASASTPSPSLPDTAPSRSTVVQAAATTTAFDRQADDWQADIGRHARQMIDAGFFPGVGIAVTRGDKVVYVGSFGVADAGSGRKVDDRTRFYIASTTKALTASAVVLQASRGTLQLEAPVTRYLPDLSFQAPLPADSVTIRDLLSMTDGIDACEPVVFRTAFTGEFTQQGLIELMQHCGSSEAGRTFAYRNLPYNILGLVLAPETNNGWKSVVRQEVLAPLGMDDTSAQVSMLDLAQVAMPHQASGGGFQRIRLAKTDATLHAAGGHFATARDLARFVAAHASDGMLDGKRIFPVGVLASTHAKQADQDRDFGPYHRFGWGYGWDLATYQGHTLVHRFGSFAGYRSHASFMPDTGIGVVVLVNGVGVPNAADALADDIYDRLVGDGVPGDRVADNSMPADTRYAAAFEALEQRKAKFAEYLAKHQAVQRERQQQPLAHPLAAYAGRYTNPQMGTMNWQSVDGHLAVAIGAARCNAETFDAAKDQLRVELTGGGEVVTFQFLNDAGPAGSLEYDGYRFERQ